VCWVLHVWMHGCREPEVPSDTVAVLPCFVARHSGPVMRCGVGLCGCVVAGRGMTGRTGVVCCAGLCRFPCRAQHAAAGQLWSTHGHPTCDSTHAWVWAHAHMHSICTSQLVWCRLSSC
jgi:hypothetical protein